MKLWGKCAAPFLAALLLALTACGQNTPFAPATEAAMGRYIEERWELPLNDANISILTPRPDGRIFALISGMEPGGEFPVMEAFTTSDGKGWQKENMPGLKALIDEVGYISDLTFGQNGECFLTYAMMDGEEYVARIARITQDGSVEDIDGEWEKASDIFLPFGLTVGGDGDLYVSQFGGTVSRFSSDGRFKVNMGGRGTPEFAYYNSQLAVINYGRYTGGAPDTFALYDTDTGGMTKDIGFTLLKGGAEQRIATGADGALYVANMSGIYRLAPDGATWEHVIDGDLCSLSIPSFSLQKLIPHGDNEFLTLSNEQDKSVLINYIYSASTPTRPTTELTVAALKKNVTLLQAAGEFRRQHPDVAVTVQTLLEEDGSATATDAIRALNTQILAGKGPDLLLLDGLPVDAYIEKGVLADMGDWLKPLIEQELLPNIAGIFEENGKVYAVPARFNMPTVWGVPEAVAAASNLESTVKYAEANTDRGLLYAMHRKDLFNYFYNTSAPAWLNGGKLDEKGFAEYLELIKRLSDTVPGAEEKQFRSNSAGGFISTGIDQGGAQYVADKHASLFAADLSGFVQLRIPNGVVAYMNGVEATPENPGIEDSLIPSYVTLFPGQASGVFIPRCILGVNAAGKQQELAREFIKTVLSETVQYSDLDDGLPVNKAAIEANIARANDTGMWSSSWDDGVTGEYRFMAMPWPSPGVRRAVCNLIGKLDTPYLPNDTLTEMILSETEGFFNGTMSAKDTAAAVAARLELYLAEQG